MASCSCIEGSGNFKFTLETLDCKTLLFEDHSQWMGEDHYEIPEEYEIEVALPGQKAPATLTVKTGIKNELDSSKLQGMEGLCLPDGVYCFSITNCGNTYKVHKGVSCRLQCCIDQAVAQLTSDKDWEAITDIRNWIHSFHSNADQGKLKHAQQAYTVAEKYLKTLNCKCIPCC